MAGEEIGYCSFAFYVKRPEIYSGGCLYCFYADMYVAEYHKYIGFSKRASFL